jgi:hypothetical protein
MTAARKKKLAGFPRSKIRSVVRDVLPKGAEFRLQVIDSNIGKMKVVRVVTPAWKSLSTSARILKLLRVMNSKLSDAERKDILRFSVLTPAELDMVNG